VKISSKQARTKMNRANIIDENIKLSFFFLIINVYFVIVDEHMFESWLKFFINIFSHTNRMINIRSFLGSLRLWVECFLAAKSNASTNSEISKEALEICVSWEDILKILKENQSKKAKEIKLADKLKNLRDMQQIIPVGWSKERVQEYFI